MGAIQSLIVVASAGQRPVMLLGGRVMLADACQELVAVDRISANSCGEFLHGQIGNFPLSPFGQVGIQWNTLSRNKYILGYVVLAPGCTIRRSED
jgi:hypothetical protein